MIAHELTPPGVSIGGRGSIMRRNSGLPQHEDDAASRSTSAHTSSGEKRADAQVAQDEQEEEEKEHETTPRSSARRWCTVPENVGSKLFTLFVGLFILGDMAKQLLIPDASLVISPTQQQALAQAVASAGAHAGASLQRVADIAAVAFTGADDPVIAFVLANGTLQAPWEAAIVTGGAAVQPFVPRENATLRERPNGVVGLLLPAGGSLEIVPVRDVAAADAEPLLGPGSIFSIRLAVLSGQADAVRAVEISLGARCDDRCCPSAACGADAAVGTDAGGGAAACAAAAADETAWSPGILLFSIAPDLAYSSAGPGAPIVDAAFQIPTPKAAIRLPSRAGNCSWSRIRVRSRACDAWGHLVGDVDCDKAPPAPIRLAVEHVATRRGGRRAVRDADRKTCAGAPLLEGHGRSCALADSCPMAALYDRVQLKSSALGGRYSDMSLIPAPAAASAGKPGAPPASANFTRLLREPAGASLAAAGASQGIRCAMAVAGTRVGCKLAMGWSTHKAVWRGTYTDPDTGAAQAVVIKEGGLRWPYPQKGERGVGFGPEDSAEAQRFAMHSMWYEMTQEVFILELLEGHPGIPQQIGACMDVDSMIATSVQAMAAVPLRRRGELTALCRRTGAPTEAALKLARSIVSLFHYLMEERYLRIEDLHWHLFDASGGVRQNATAVAGNDYAEDDISQFAVDSVENLNFQIIDLDKVVVNHDEQLRWYVADIAMPYVAAQLLPPLLPFLPALSLAISRMAAKDPMQRPPSFACVAAWLEQPDALYWMTAADEARWAPLPCDPEVYNKGVTGWSHGR